MEWRNTMSNKEKVGYLDEDFKFFYIKDNFSVNIENHHHDFNKIVIFISGNVQYSIEGKSYNLKPWDILLIAKNEIHRCDIDISKPYERIVIWIKDDIDKNNKYLGGVTNCFSSNKDKNTHMLRLKESSVSLIKSLTSKLLKYNNNIEPYDSILTNSFLIQILAILNKEYLKDNNENINKDIFYDETTENIINYINNNLTNSLTIQKLSEEFNLSKHYLMRKFKKQTGYSIHNYIIQKRLMYSIELMDTTSCMYEISEESGFNDYSTFVRAFKKNYDISPKRYFENNRKKRNINLID